MVDGGAYRPWCDRTLAEPLPLDEVAVSIGDEEKSSTDWGPFHVTDSSRRHINKPVNSKCWFSRLTIWLFAAGLVILSRGTGWAYG